MGVPGSADEHILKKTPNTPEQRYAMVVAALAGSPNVTHASDVAGSKKFGSSALKVNGKIFAMVVNDALVVKIPRERVAAMIASGAGTPFGPGHGRVMKEWLSLDPASAQDWLAIANEAMSFVGSKR